MTMMNILRTAVVITAGFATSFAHADTYTSAEVLADTLADAVRSRSIETMENLFGENARETLTTGSVVKDIAIWASFIEAYDQEHIVQEIYGKYAILMVGDDNWAFPMPMVKGEDGFWTFDVEEGVKEMARREIGRNELEVIRILTSYVDIQASYRRTDWDGDGVLEFASDIISSEGKKDGLFWPGQDSPAGDYLARAELFGFLADGEFTPPEPLAGYLFRLFSKQGEHAPGGAMDYLVNGNQVAGHAALAVPAEYGVTGVMSFIVSENGQVLQRDLGEDTYALSLEMDAYDPDEEWVPAN